MSEPAPHSRDLIFEVFRPLAEEREVSLSLDTDLGADLALDSIHIIELMLDIEDVLDISIPQNILPNVRTLGDLVRELDRLRAS